MTAESSDGSPDVGGWDAPWPLRASLGDWSAMAKAWAAP